MIFHADIKATEATVDVFLREEAGQKFKADGYGVVRIEMVVISTKQLESCPKLTNTAVQLASSACSSELINIKPA